MQLKVTKSNLTPTTICPEPKHYPWKISSLNEILKKIQERVRCWDQELYGRKL